MKKRMRKLVAIALASAMSITMGSTAFAADKVAEGTEANPAKAYVTKEFQMPEGTATPTSEFKFKVDPVSVDGKDSDGTNMPTVSDATISFGSSDEGKTEGDVKTIVKSAESDIFAGVTWPHAGVYKYTITETASGVTVADAANETVTYSKASYTATVYVKNGTDGTYASAISVVQTKDDKGDTTGGDEGTKVDPSPYDPSTGQGGNVRFTNTYTKKITPTPVTPDPDPDNPGKTDDNDKGLAVRKIVTGDLGDKTLDFNFTVKVTAPSLLKDTVTEYKAQIVSADGSKKDVTFTSGTAQTIQLKHGQELVFTDLYVGSAFEVQETNLDKNYTATTWSVANSGTPTSKSGAEQITGKVSEGSDLVSVVNERTEEPPTGIVVNNLPFILMIAVVIAGFAAYIAIRRRRFDA